MSSRPESRTLFETLQGLYSQFVLMILERRMKSYHQKTGAQARRDIAGLLSEEIRQLAVAVPSIDEGANSDNSTDVVQSTTAKQSSQVLDSKIQNAKITNTASELSNHLRRRQSGSALNPELGERLMKSTREHIHAVHRLARQGKVRTAAMHADIANHALREAGHYMSEDEYADFIAGIEQELMAMKQQQGS
jgi:hypothetical protein